MMADNAQALASCLIVGEPADRKLDFPHLHGGADQVSPCRISRSQSCRDFSHFTPGHRYAKSRTRSLR